MISELLIFREDPALWTVRAFIHVISQCCLLFWNLSQVLKYFSVRISCPTQQMLF